MNEIMLRSIAAKVINGKLLEGVFLSLPLDKSETDPEVIEKLSVFVYGEPPNNFTPEWWEAVSALANTLVEKHPEYYEPMKEAMEEIVRINEAVLGRV